jgi:hypothetical protein
MFFVPAISQQPHPASIEKQAVVSPENCPSLYTLSLFTPIPISHSASYHILYGSLYLPGFARMYCDEKELKQFGYRWEECLVKKYGIQPGLCKNILIKSEGQMIYHPPHTDTSCLFMEEIIQNMKKDLWREDVDLVGVFEGNLMRPQGFCVPEIRASGGLWP